MKFLGYLKRRLGEKSTWGGALTAITGAALLPEPWSWVAAVVGTVAALVPEEGKPDDVA